MTYSDIGKRDWVNLKEIVREVEESYLEHLITMDAYKKLHQSEKEKTSLDAAKEWVTALQ